MYRIGKRFRFEAAHWLPGLPQGHKCARMHGHSYTVRVTVEAGGLTPPGFVVDFAQLAPLGDLLASRFDHRCLNEVLPDPPTSEHLARWLFVWCQGHLPLPPQARVVAVRVSETPSTFAEYRADPS